VGVRKGYVQTQEHKDKLQAGAKRRWAKKLRDPEDLPDTACSLCYEFAQVEDFLELRRYCTGVRATRRCVLKIIWTRFLNEFKRRKR